MAHARHRSTSAPRARRSPAWWATMTMTLGLLGQTSSAEPCVPRAQLGGDAEAVAKVRVELERLGVEASTTAATTQAAVRAGDCPVIVAMVELDRDGGIAVAVQDAARRSEGRVVSDAALAAAWIDSWLRDDFYVALEQSELPLPSSGPLRERPPSETPAISARTEGSASALEAFAVTAAFTQTWTADNTWWSGGGVAACVRAGGFCFGVRGGFAAQDLNLNATGAARRDLSVLAIASYAHALGRMVVAPELGIGAGQLTTSRIEGCKVQMTCDPSDPTCVATMPPPPACSSDPGTIYVGDDFSATAYTPRIAAALRIAVPLFDHVWLDGLASFALAPFGHDDAYKSTNAMLALDDTLALPGNPLFGVQLGIGLRVGSP